VPLSYPQTAWDPYRDVRLYIDLTTTSAGFDPVPHGGAYVPLFSDLKRHDMGEDLAEDFEDFGMTRPVTIDNNEFVTARLWGIADTAPYLHDGRASTLREAIEKHGGEAALVKQAFDDLSWLDKLRVIYFLKPLRTPKHPNEEL